MATSKRVVSVSVKRPKRDRAQKIRTVLNESTVASVATGEAMGARHAPTDAELHEGIVAAARDMGLEYRKVRPHDDDCITLCPDDPAGCKIGHSCWCGDEKAPHVTDGIGVVRLDPALLDMLRGYVETIRTVYPDVSDVETWDRPWDPAWVGTHEGCGRQLTAEVCHAIGGIAGAAAMMDLTPCMLIANLGL